ncbi:MAG TPA: oxygenase MpaB family protein [Bradyrhizobium sp.]|nr:oxygenase MpaB family protein [Bradyrhizobium sp.]
MMPAATIGDEDLEHQLRLVRAEAAGPVAGVFGPHSLTWRFDREAVIFLGAGRALLLQLAHPWVSAAIAEHSRTFADPIGRFHRTFNVMFTMVFGTLDQALTAARRLHRRHAAVIGVMPQAVGPFARGSPYSANEVCALRWVHATLIDTALAARALVFPALTADEHERYYAECRLFAALFAIPQSCLPTNWDAFVAYKEAMWESEVLSVSAEARAIARQILQGTAIWLRPPEWYRAITTQMLPPSLREAFGLRYGQAEHQVAETATTWVRRAYPGLPERLRYVGPYLEAKARLAGSTRPDLFTQISNKLWTGRSLLG